MGNPCDNFLNRPKTSYRPLACKPIVVTTRELTGHGLANRLDLFFITKPNTIREHATVDLLYPTPNWLNNIIHPVTRFVRETQNGHIRVTKGGHTRVVDLP